MSDLPYLDDNPIYIHSQLAAALGLTEGVVLGRLAFWLAQNRKKKSNDHYRDGQWWAYNSIADWQRSDFDFFGVSTVKRAFEKLHDTLKLVKCETYKYQPDYAISKKKWWSIDEDLYKLFFELWDSCGRPRANEKLQRDPEGFPIAYDEFLEQCNSIISSMGQNDPTTGQNDPTQQVKMTQRWVKMNHLRWVKMTHLITESPESQTESRSDAAVESDPPFLEVDSQPDIRPDSTDSIPPQEPDAVPPPPAGVFRPTLNGRRVLRGAAVTTDKAKRRKTAVKAVEKQGDETKQRVAALKKVIQREWAAQFNGNAFVVAQAMAEQMIGVSTDANRESYNFDRAVTDPEEVEKFVEWYYEKYEADTALPMKAESLARQFGMFWNSTRSADHDLQRQRNQRTPDQVAADAERQADDHLFDTDFEGWVNKHVDLACGLTGEAQLREIAHLYVNISMPTQRKHWRGIIQDRTGIDPIDAVEKLEILDQSTRYHIGWRKELK